MNHTVSIGSVALATLLTGLMSSCASHKTSAVTPINLPKIQGVAAAPASLNGKTLILTSSPQKITRISFKTLGPTLVMGKANEYIIEYSTDEDSNTMARVTIRPNNGGEGGWYFLKMRFNGANTGTYRLEKEMSTDGSDPNQLVEKGSFVIQ